MQYHNHEQSLKSSENIGVGSCSLSSFRYSNSASLRAFASQMTLHQASSQASSSEEFLNQHSSVSVSNSYSSTSKAYSTMSLNRFSNEDTPDEDDEDEQRSGICRTEAPKQFDLFDEHSNLVGSNRRYLSLGESLNPFWIKFSI